MLIKRQKVIDNVLSHSAKVPLSANQGRLLDEKIDNSISALVLSVPVGAVLAYGGDAAPEGYLECNGQPVTEVHPELLALMAFVPDLRGEFVRGWDNGRSVDAGRGLMTVQAATRISPQVVNHSIVDVDNEDSSVSDGTQGDSSAGVGSPTNKTFKSVRPRNVALMYIIKAVA